MKQQKALTLKTLTKSNVWELRENDILRMWESARKESDFKDNKRHYFDVIKSAFEIEEIKIDRPEVIKKYEARGFKIGSLGADEGDNSKWGIKKRQITFICTRYFRHILHITLVEMYLKPCIKRAYKKPSVQFTSIRSYPPDNTVLLLCVYKGGDVKDIEVSLH